YYDGQGTWNAPPSKGLATRTDRWLSTTGSFLSTTVEYDGSGNVAAEIDSTGARTSYVLDPTYSQYIVQTTNGVGQVLTAEWDFVCGQQVRSTNPNGQVITVRYDALCRQEQANTALGGFEIRSRLNEGDANAQYEQVETPSADGSGNLWTRTY